MIIYTLYILKKNLCVCILLLVLIFSSCKDKRKPVEVQSHSQETGKLIEYYKKNNWAYPIEIVTDSIKYSGSNKNIIISPDSLKALFIKWYYSDKILDVHRKGGTVIYDIRIKWLSKSKAFINCSVDFYTEGEIKNGMVAPMEGQAIIENKFLRQREAAVLILENSSLAFSKWQRW